MYNDISMRARLLQGDKTTSAEISICSLQHMYGVSVSKIRSSKQRLVIYRF